MSYTQQTGVHVPLQNNARAKWHAPRRWYWSFATDYLMYGSIRLTEGNHGSFLST